MSQNPSIKVPLFSSTKKENTSIFRCYPPFPKFFCIKFNFQPFKTLKLNQI